MIFHPADESDIPTVLHYICEIARYEKMENDVIATQESLRDWMFERGLVKSLLLKVGGETIGFVLYFFNFSTFVGRGGLYVEDIYIDPEHRGKGYGKATFRRLAQIAQQNGCGRMEWVCLNWNKPSIDIYLSMGAEPMDEWTTYRLDAAHIAKLAESE